MSCQNSLNPDTVHRGQIQISSYYSFYTDDKANLSIEVEDKLLTREHLLAWVAAFLGAFLTLPGILAFLQKRREEREKSTSTQKEKQIIVEP